MWAFLSMLLMPGASAMDYIVVEQEKTWLDAEGFCQSEYGTHLATITDDASAQVLMDVWQVTLESSGRTSGGWMGLNDINDEGMWLYSDGSHCSTADNSCGSAYKYWDETQAPNDCCGGQDCAVVMAYKVRDNDYENMLNDYDCGALFWFACNLSNDTSVDELCETRGLQLEGFPHECRCRTECDKENRFCNSMEFVTHRLRLELSGDELCPDESASQCCCSCPNCPRYIALS